MHTKLSGFSIKLDLGSIPDAISGALCMCALGLVDYLILLVLLYRPSTASLLCLTQ